MADNRGRLQVQGDDMKPELSRPWNQATPRKASAALSDLDDLREDCTDKQRKPRERYFIKARNFIERVRDEGGYDVSDAGNLKQSFPPEDRADEKGRRVDVEVSAGLAFVV